MNLAPYAATESNSRGRRHTESPPRHRTTFQRDRDRVIHCAAFRRLEYKTQVFVNHEGDLFRTRLTHSIEVAQIGRSIARALNLNEDLTEAIALAHDLGHTPFGHVGQDALNDCMRDRGGFEHNLQSLRVVDVLEERYPEFNGLNLTFESREGILKHCSPKKAAALGEVGERFLRKEQPGLEAQLANLADEIAYNNHDVDDGLRSGLIATDQLATIELFATHWTATVGRYPDLGPRRQIHETIRRMIGYVVGDVIESSARAIADENIGSIDDVRARGAALIRYSDHTRSQLLELKRFLRDALYAHDRVRDMSQRARQTIKDLFDAYHDDPTQLPAQYRERIGRAADWPTGADTPSRVIADYIAGMTDRYAIREYTRLAGGELWRGYGADLGSTHPP